MTARAPRSTGRPHVVVVGDVVLDRDLVGTAERLAPDAPVPVLDVSSLRETPGGAGLAALLAAGSGARVTLVAPIADDDGGARLRALLEPHVELIAVGHQGPTRRKTRVRSSGQSLLRIDDGGPGRPTDLPVERIGRALATADAVLVADYGAGTTTDLRMRDLLTSAASRVRMVWDPHPKGGRPVRRATLVTPNLSEATAADRALNGADPSPGADSPPGTDPSPGADSPPGTDSSRGGPHRSAHPDLLALRLRAAWSADAVCVTAGSDGAFLATTDHESQFLPAPIVRGGDSCGAGDRFAATAAVRLAFGDLTSEAAASGVRDASAWVADGGTGSFRMPDGPMAEQPVPDGIPTPDRLDGLARRLRTGGRTLVATGGCFDIVHAGHVATLQAARRLGDALVVLINSDASVARLKGPERPLIEAADRARVLEAFDCVDAVVIFDDDDPRTALEQLRPDIWVKGGDYGGTELPEAATVQAGGGRVVFLPYLTGRSTTSIIERSRSQSEQPA
ncbi:PfkB family carbohydrate kinase [Nakamurella sp. GG22]